MRRPAPSRTPMIGRLLVLAMYAVLVTAFALAVS
jgi:hypothetical protein